MRFQVRAVNVVKSIKTSDRMKMQASQGGVIGITVFTAWMVPKYDNVASMKAASRARDFLIGW